MKAYFVNTNADNGVIFEQDGKCKINYGENGYLDGIDLYNRNETIENLKTYFETNDINGFNELYGDEYDFADFTSDDNYNITFICNID